MKSLSRKQATFKGFLRRRNAPRPPAVLVALRAEEDARRLGEIEHETEAFRARLSKCHRVVVQETAREYRAARHEGDAEVMRAAERRGEWHARRARGQIERFRRVRGCGERSLVVTCGRCGDRGEPIAESCGVRRLCPRCSGRFAIRSRARFGHARARLAEAARAEGKDYKWRHGGRWGEKMLTLTLPHFERDPAPMLFPGSAHCSRWAAYPTTTEARVAAAFEAWRLFSRKLQAWARSHKHHGIAWLRSFEWTPGDDGLGHPHFHVWLFAPFLPRRAEHRCSSCGQRGCAPVDRWWAEALREVGVPVQGAGADVRVKLQTFEPLSRDVVAEVLKGGVRQALAASRLGVAGYGPTDAVDYAAGWSMTVESEGCPAHVVAALYRALEGRRLNQASRGFFEADAPAQCECCGSSGWFHVELVSPLANEHDAFVAERLAIRGPP